MSAADLLEQIRQRNDMLILLRAWVDEGSFIGVFENKALDSALLGHRVAFPFENHYDPVLIVGQTRAPDSRQFIGWKYILLAKTRDPEEAVTLVMREELGTDAEAV